MIKYLELQRFLKRTFQVLTFIISVSGILGWKYFEEYVWIALILIAVFQLLLLIENVIIRSDKEIEDISNLRMMYTRYFNKIELLWTKYKYNKIKKGKAIERYFELRQTDWVNMEDLDSKLNVKRYKWLIKSAKKETTDYLTQYHNYG